MQSLQAAKAAADERQATLTAQLEDRAVAGEATRQQLSTLKEQGTVFTAQQGAVIHTQAREIEELEGRVSELVCHLLSSWCY